MSVPRQFFPSFRLLRVPVDGCRGNVLLESVQLGFEVCYLLLEIFELLRASVSVVCDGYQLDQYLVMLDERVHSTEGGLEGREPICGLFCNIEEDFRAIGDSLPLCWEIQTVRELASWKALSLLTSILVSVTPGDPGICQTSLLKHGVAGMVRGKQIFSTMRRPQSQRQPRYLGGCRQLMHRSIHSSPKDTAIGRGMQGWILVA
jgi:hypothetical protein